MKTGKSSGRRLALIFMSSLLSGRARDLDAVVVEAWAAAEVGVPHGGRRVHVRVRRRQLRPLRLERERDAGPGRVVYDCLCDELAAVVPDADRIAARESACGRVLRVEMDLDRTDLMAVPGVRPGRRGAVRTPRRRR